MKKKINKKFIKIQSNSYDPNLFRDEKFTESEEYLTKMATHTMRKKSSRDNLKRFTGKS